MASNVKISTPDVLEILDTKIKASADHTRLAVTTGETYDSVLSKIAARSPTLDQRDALESALSPSGANPFVTIGQLNIRLEGAIPWKTIGPIGSEADFMGADETPFQNAFLTVPTYVNFYVLPGTYTFSTPVTIPDGVKLFGSNTAYTLCTSNTDTVFRLGQENYLGFMTILTSGTTATALDATNSIYSTIENCITFAPSTGYTIDISNSSNLQIFDTASIYGVVYGLTIDNSIISNLYVDAPGTAGLYLDTPSSLTLCLSTFYAGTPTIVSGTNVRVVANHFNNGSNNNTPISSVIFRANTPDSNNNEDSGFNYLLQYIGSPSYTQPTPVYSNNFAGPQGQDLTARASALDLLIQWRYEERNWLLMAQSEPTTVTWNPSTTRLTTSSGLQIVSAHREALWLLPTISNLLIPTGWMAYYFIDRSLNTLDITLSVQTAPLGSLPLDPNPPTGSPTYRQIYVLAFNQGGTLFWRGGGGSRFPSGNTGVYYVDGTSKNILDYIGSLSYNDSDPNYTSNFAGVQGDSLTTRLGQLDKLLKRLFEFSNLGFYLDTNAYFYIDTSPLYLTGTLYFTIPNVAGRLTLAPQNWTLSDGDLIYLTWNQETLAGSDQAVTATIATTVPLVDNYPGTTKYFVLAARKGSYIYMFDGSKIPLSGGRWPVPSGHSIAILSSPSVLLQNMVWDGTNFLWEGLGVVVSTGINTNRNTLVDRTSAYPGLTNLAEGEGLIVTHTWNAGVAQNASVSKVTLPIAGLDQNQFLWVQRRNGTLFFNE